MALPGNVSVVRVRGYYYDGDGTGYAAGTITFTPQVSDLTDMVAFANIHPKIFVVHPDPTTGYFFADLIATDDPDITNFAWRVVRTDGAGNAVLSSLISVPYNSPITDVGAGLMKQALWLTAAATTTAPPPPVTTYYTSAQVDSLVATAVGTEPTDRANAISAHVADLDPHAAASYTIMVGGGRRLWVQNTDPTTTNPGVPRDGDIWISTA